MEGGGGPRMQPRRSLSRERRRLSWMHSHPFLFALRLQLVPSHEHMCMCVRAPIGMNGCRGHTRRAAIALRCTFPSLPARTAEPGGNSVIHTESTGAETRTPRQAEHVKITGQCCTTPSPFSMPRLPTLVAPLLPHTHTHRRARTHARPPPYSYARLSSVCAYPPVSPARRERARSVRGSILGYACA